MNVIDFIFQLFHIRNRPTLFVLAPLHSPYTPSINCAHLSTNFENTSSHYTNFFANYTHNSNGCVDTPND